MNAIHLARTLMFELVSSEIPVRMSLASGSYRMLRFVSDSSSHVTFHMSQFLERVLFAHIKQNVAAFRA